MFKRGSKLVIRVLFTATLVSVRALMLVLLSMQYKAHYEKNKLSKPEMVALGAIMYKVCSIIFAVLRDNTPFVLKALVNLIKYTILIYI